MADGTITSGAELIVTGSGGWKLKGALDEADSKKLAEGQKVSISMDAGGRSREVTIDSTRSGSDGSGDGNSVSGAGADASASTDSSGDGGTKGGGFWYSSLPEGMSAGYGDTFTWKAQVPSARSYDYKIPLAALREDTAGNYCLIVSEEESALGSVKKAKRVDVTVLEKNGEEAAVEAELQKTDQVIAASEKYVEEGDRIRIKD